MTRPSRERQVPSRTIPAPNRSTENQPSGSGRRPRDTLDREPKRDPHSGGSIPAGYDPDAQARRGEERETGDEPPTP
jgi:hypothetical protein